METTLKEPQPPLLSSINADVLPISLALDWNWLLVLSISTFYLILYYVKSSRLLLKLWMSMGAQTHTYTLVHAHACSHPLTFTPQSQQVMSRWCFMFRIDNRNHHLESPSESHIQSYNPPTSTCILSSFPSPIIKKFNQSNLRQVLLPIFGRHHPLFLRNLYFQWSFFSFVHASSIFPLNFHEEYTPI